MQYHRTDLQLLHQSSSMVSAAHTRSTKGNNSKGGKKKGNTRGTSAYIDDTAAPYLPLPAGMLNIKRLVNANVAEPSNQTITGE